MWRPYQYDVCGFRRQLFGSQNLHEELVEDQILERRFQSTDRAAPGRRLVEQSGNKILSNSFFCQNIRIGSEQVKDYLTSWKQDFSSFYYQIFFCSKIY